MSNGKTINPAQLEIFMRELAKLLADCTNEEAFNLYCTVLAQKKEIRRENEASA